MRRIAPAVFGLPIVVTDTLESVAVGAARQAAWALTGTLPDWPVPVPSQPSRPRTTSGLQPRSASVTGVAGGPLRLTAVSPSRAARTVPEGPVCLPRWPAAAGLSTDVGYQGPHCRAGQRPRWRPARTVSSPGGSGSATTGGSPPSPRAPRRARRVRRGAAVVDVGSSLVMPGLIDLHNHLAYNTLPLWTEPSAATPFAHHNSWTRAETLRRVDHLAGVRADHRLPEELLAYVEAKAVVGGTTTIQGSPPKNRPRDGWLVRNVEDETFGTRQREPRLRLGADREARRAGRAGQQDARRARPSSTTAPRASRGSIVAREFTDAETAGCLQPRFVAVHANAVDPAGFARWTTTGRDRLVAVLQPLALRHDHRRPAARAAGITVCLGSDWAPSGTKHVLGELKVARLVADHLGWDLTDADLVKMVTCNPGDVLARAWERQVGRLQPGARPTWS